MGKVNQAKIELSEYNPEWIVEFEKEKVFLIEKIGQWLCGSIEHVGSTAVPGLMAKPVIDIMFGVESLAKSKPAIDILVNNGYCHFPYKEDVMHWFCKPSDAHRTHHLHLIPFESVLWKERILFRNILRSNKNVAKEYQELKKKLATRYVNDRELYTEKKWPFIRKSLKMKVKIEIGRSEDLPAINDIYNYYVIESNATFDIDEWGEQRRIKWFEQFANSGVYNLLVAKIKDEVIGFAYNSKFKEKPAYITSSEVTVYIKPGSERNGLGGKLYESLLSKISASNLHRLYAVITIPNPASIRLHKKFGFNIIGTMKEVGFKNGQFHSTAILEKCISDSQA